MKEEEIWLADRWTGVTLIVPKGGRSAGQLSRDQFPLGFGKIPKDHD